MSIRPAPVPQRRVEMSELRFATKEEALQHLADITGSKIKIAEEMSEEEELEDMQEEQSLEEDRSIEIPSYQIPVNLQNERFATEDEALQHLADITGSKIKIASYSLVDVFMERDDMTKTEAEEYVEELKGRVADGEGPEEVLADEGLEPDYFFDLV